MGTVISDLLRNVFMFLDSIVYSVIGKVYELFIAIANTNIFADGTINEFANRVYALLAIFMLFRLSFSVLTYIINPDNINDKSAGGGKLIGNILITIILLISVPWLFQQVMKIQGDLLNDNIIGKIILGVNGDPNNQDVQDKIEQSISSQLNAGDNMAWTTFSAFFSLTDECAALPNECTVNFPKVTGTDNAYDRIKKSQLVSGIKDSGLATVRAESGEYVFEYLPIISTIAGGFIAYILLLFCFQIAVRSVKLGVLQLIAPIPVISYLDPKQGKDGMFKKWLKVCGKTFADLFIRLAAIYFAIFIITEITNGRGMIDITTGDTQTSLLVKVLIILGALMFAKELPKFIEEITGIKLGGSFSLNPMKTLASIPLVGGAAAAGLAVGSGLAKTGLWAGGNLAKAGIQAGAGKLFGKDKWTEAGKNTIRGMNEGGLSRLNATLAEGKGRIKGSGIMGSDKYSGDTRSSLLAKEKTDLTKQKRDARVAIAKKQALYDKGIGPKARIGDITDSILKNDASANNFEKWRNATDLNDYKSSLAEQLSKEYGSVYSSQEFANSAANLEVGKEALKYTEQRYSEAQSSFNAVAMSYSPGTTEYENAAKSLSEARELHNKQQKAVSSMEENHKLMGQKHASDAELESAIGVAKGVRPGS